MKLYYVTSDPPITEVLDVARIQVHVNTSWNDGEEYVLKVRQDGYTMVFEMHYPNGEIISLEEINLGPHDD